MAPKLDPTSTDRICRCTHPRGDHARNAGECLEDECSCTAFRLAPNRDQPAPKEPV